MPDRHFLVVGGTRGIGLALVKHLLGEGDWCVSVLGRRPGLDIQSPRLKYYQVDVTDRDRLIPVLDLAVACFGKLTCAVFLQRHRAGDDAFESELAVALEGSKDAIEHLVQTNGFSDHSDANNSIVFVSSIADSYIAPEQPLGYHIGKAGISQLARYYALSLGSLGIRVNVVSPCVVAKDEAMEFYENNQWLVDGFKKHIPLGRMGKPQDIVQTIMFLASEQASYITGQNIVVDGGLTLRSHESLIRDLIKGE